jgi:hypothetical protein
MSTERGGVRGDSPLTARCLGAALALAACDPPATVHAPVVVKVLVVIAAALAWWAAPMVDERPAQTSMRWAALAVRRRTTLLAAASVAVAALTGPPVWTAACVAVLLLAYLLVTDPWAGGVTAPAGPRPAGPASAAAAACALVFLAAEVPLSDTSWARLPAALAVVATTSCLALALRHRGSPARR